MESDYLSVKAVALDKSQRSTEKNAQAILQPSKRPSHKSIIEVMKMKSTWNLPLSSFILL